MAAVMMSALVLAAVMFVIAVCAGWIARLGAALAGRVGSCEVHETVKSVAIGLGSVSKGGVDAGVISASAISINANHLNNE